MLSETMLLLYLAPMALVGVLGGPAVHHRRHQYKHSQRSAVLISGAAYAPARLATGGGSQQTITTSFACKKWSEVLMLYSTSRCSTCNLHPALCAAAATCLHRLRTVALCIESART